MRHKSISNMESHKILVCGTSGCGKTTYVNRTLTGEYTNKTNGSPIYVKTASLSFGLPENPDTNTLINLAVWDISSQSIETVEYDYFHQPSGVIVFFDLTKEEDWDILQSIVWVAYERTFGMIPIHFCGLKLDLINDDNRKLLDKFAEIKDNTHNLFDNISRFKPTLSVVSSRNNTNIDQPITMILRAITGSERKEWVYNEPVKPVEAIISQSINYEDYE